MSETQKPECDMNVRFAHNPDLEGVRSGRHAFEVRPPGRRVGMLVMGLDLDEAKSLFPELPESATDTDDEPSRTAE